MSRNLRVLCAALAISGGVAHADAITDPSGDFIAGFTGVHNADLDVLGASVSYDTGSNTFFFSGTMAGAIGTTASSLYVWGVDRGQGTARFGAVASGVLFDSVVSLKADGTGTVTLFGASNVLETLPVGSVTVSGNTISGSVSGLLLPSNGLPLSAFTWNLWPRDTTQAGVAAISDFAPDNANVAITAVPEPSTCALLALGLGALAWRRRSA